MIQPADWYIAGVALSLRATVTAVYGRFESGQFDPRELPALRAVARELTGVAITLPREPADLRDATIALAVALQALLEVMENEGRDARAVYNAECDAAMARLAGLMKLAGNQAVD